MNIFYLDEDPNLAAQYQYDKHVIKMILETAQLLSTAHRVLDGSEYIEKSQNNRNIRRYLLLDEREEILYKATHMNHPSAIWARESKENYLWLYKHFLALIKEYNFRYNKHHASERLIPYLEKIPKNIPNKPFTPVALAIDSEFIVSQDNVLNYRYYYFKAKSHLMNYTKRQPPEWLIDSDALL